MSSRAPDTSRLNFSCVCGAVTGDLRDVGAASGDHVVCHCTDRQNFARCLHAHDRVLDEAGGTALYQGRCATMRINTGRDQLACFHLTRKPTLRWYAACCKTPMFNTYATGRIPYITTLVINCDPERRSDRLGPIKGHLFVREATGDASDLQQMSTLKLMRRFFVRMLADIASGDRRRSELFKAVSLLPIARPKDLCALEASEAYHLL